jgi:hypothetical protein
MHSDATHVAAQNFLSTTRGKKLILLIIEQLRQMPSYCGRCRLNIILLIHGAVATLVASRNVLSSMRGKKVILLIIDQLRQMPS